MQASLIEAGSACYWLRLRLRPSGNYARPFGVYRLIDPGGAPTQLVEAEMGSPPDRKFPMWLRSKQGALTPDYALRVARCWQHAQSRTLWVGFLTSAWSGQ